MDGVLWYVKILDLFSYVACGLGVILKKSLPNSVLRSFLPMFFMKILAFIFEFDLLWVNFCVWYKEKVQIHSFVCGCWKIQQCWLLLNIRYINVFCIHQYEFISGLFVLLHWSICLFYVGITLLWLWLCNKFWDQETYDLKLYCFLRLLWLFGGSLEIPYEI